MRLTWWWTLLSHCDEKGNLSKSCRGSSCKIINQLGTRNEQNQKFMYAIFLNYKACIKVLFVFYVFSKAIYACDKAPSREQFHAYLNATNLSSR